MSTAAASASRRAVLEHASRTAAGTNLALTVATQIGSEWRLFCNLTLIGRAWWLLTGRISRRLVHRAGVLETELEGDQG